MDNNSAKSRLIGITLADTLVNLSAVLMLLRSLNFNDDINEEAQYGLFTIHGLIQDSLEYEIQRLSKRKT